MHLCGQSFRVKVKPEILLWHSTEWNYSKQEICVCSFSSFSVFECKWVFASDPTDWHHQHHLFRAAAHHHRRSQFWIGSFNCTSFCPFGQQNPFFRTPCLRAPRIASMPISYAVTKWNGRPAFAFPRHTVLLVCTHQNWPIWKWIYGKTNFPLMPKEREENGKSGFLENLHNRKVSGFTHFHAKHIQKKI